MLAVGYRLDEIFNDITKKTPASFEPTIDYTVVKVPRFAFEKFSDSKHELGSQMKSKSGKNEALATKAAVSGKPLGVGLKRGDGQHQTKTAMKGGKRK